MHENGAEPECCRSGNQCPPWRNKEIVRRKGAVTADMALRLAKAFGTSGAFWLRLEADYDPEAARKVISGGLKKVE